MSAAELNLEDWFDSEAPVEGPRASLPERVSVAREECVRCISRARETIGAVLSDDRIAGANFPPLPSIGSGVASPADLALRLRTIYLDPMKALVFNGEASLRLPVGGKALNRVTRRLCEAAEELRAVEAEVALAAAELADTCPGFPADLYGRAAPAAALFRQWQGTSPRVSDPALLRLLQSAELGEPLQLALFVCPPMEYVRLGSAAPEEFVGLDMQHSVLARLVRRLRTLLAGLEQSDIPFDITAIIGDTDEDDYLWPVLPAPRVDKALVDQRRERLSAHLFDYLTEPCGAAPRLAARDSVRVLRLSAMPRSEAARRIRAHIAADPSAHFDAVDRADEVAMMKKLWKPGSYYDGLPRPLDNALDRIVARKFASYAMQGVQLWELEPNLLLLQTERPPRLRTKMLDAGRRLLGLPELPMLQFFGAAPPHPCALTSYTLEVGLEEPG